MKNLNYKQLDELERRWSTPEHVVKLRIPRQHAVIMFKNGLIDRECYLDSLPIPDKKPETRWDFEKIATSTRSAWDKLPEMLNKTAFWVAGAAVVYYIVEFLWN